MDLAFISLIFHHTDELSSQLVQRLLCSPPMKPELIAPAGNMECARAAVANGADAVYFGLDRFNARMRADNFTEESLPEVVRFLREHNVRAFCTLNTLIFTDELPAVERELILLDQAGVDVVIVQDLGVAKLARELGVCMDVHASTQMTITSPEGVAFASRLGIKRVVIARETSLRELAKFGTNGVSLETFVHGALCVAYSGQCLTSEALGQRSANRGECAQACRLPYDLIVDGALKDLGDRRYLLSPQDLAAVKEIPELIKLGVTGFKIEGRLKSPEYVAATCQVYRKAIDAAALSPEDQYKLEMTFSRGLYTGWMHGVNHQQLVHARFGKKRGPFVGSISNVEYDHVEVETQTPLKAGDGVVFDTGGDTDKEQGGRIWQVRDRQLFFERGHIDFTKLKPGDRVWKTSDPKLERGLRKTFAGAIPRPKRKLDLIVSGSAGKLLTVEANGIRVHSSMPLQTAYKRPMSTPVLRDQLGRLGETDFELGEVHNKLAGQVILPVSELNRLRRELVSKLNAPVELEPRASLSPILPQLLAQIPKASPADATLQLIALCRTLDQVHAALESSIRTIYVDFEDLRRYPEAVALVRGCGTIFLGTPRIQKAGEQGFFKLIENAQPDGVLIRNLGALDYFRQSPLRKIGDFSLNVANPLSADLLMREGLERITISYDCNAQQVLGLFRAAPARWFELVIHQHMPMFHMEHCVFAAFLSTGTDSTNCGRPCDTHNLKLRDRIGIEHPVKADVGCRNTVFHAKAQSGAEFLQQFLDAGARAFRVELLEEDATQARQILEAYRDLLAGKTENVKHLNTVRQLGVTSGTLTVLG
jgi:putative protease